MKVRDIPAGLRQSVTSLVVKLCTDMFFSLINAYTLIILSIQSHRFVVVFATSQLSAF